MSVVVCCESKFDSAEVDLVRAKHTPEMQARFVTFRPLKQSTIHHSSHSHGFWNKVLPGVHQYLIPLPSKNYGETAVMVCCWGNVVWDNGSLYTVKWYVCHRPFVQTISQSFTSTSPLTATGNAQLWIPIFVWIPWCCCCCCCLWWHVSKIMHLTRNRIIMGRWYMWYVTN